MMAKVDVNGSAADPLYHVAHPQQRGFLGSKGIKWNFTKFLIGRDGEVIKRFGSRDEPAALAPDIGRGPLQADGLRRLGRWRWRPSWRSPGSATSPTRTSSWPRCRRGCPGPMQSSRLPGWPRSRSRLRWWPFPAPALVGWLTAAFFVAIFPGNVSQFLTGTDGFGLDSDAARAIRLLFQPLLVVWALWCTGAWRDWRDGRRGADGATSEAR